MATNFTNQNFLDVGASYKYPIRLGVIFFPRVRVNLIGAGVTSDRFSLGFDQIPILTGQAAVIGNWSISGGPTVLSVTNVLVNLNSVEIVFSGSVAEGKYTINIPTGIIADSGVSGSPFAYQGPFAVDVPTPTLNANPVLVSITVPSPNTIAIQVSENVTALPSTLVASNWVITGPTSVSVQSVSVSGPTITLSTTEQRTGGSYTISVPGFLGTVSGNPYDGPFSLAFTGQGVAPQALRAVVLSPTSLRVIYSEVVQAAGALVPANYAINNGLTVLSVTQETGNQYLLTTTQQNPGVLYTITVSNVLDLQGNLI